MRETSSRYLRTAATQQLVRPSGAAKAARVAFNLPAGPLSGHRDRQSLSPSESGVITSPRTPLQLEPAHLRFGTPHSNSNSSSSTPQAQMPGKHELDRCFATNSSWANAVAQENPDFFPSLAQGQRPKILWFGCADSRVPESVVLAVKPGEIFVHRNIAKCVSPFSSEHRGPDPRQCPF